MDLTQIPPHPSGRLGCFFLLIRGMGGVTVTLHISKNTERKDQLWQAKDLLVMLSQLYVVFLFRDLGSWSKGAC